MLTINRRLAQRGRTIKIGYHKNAIVKIEKIKQVLKIHRYIFIHFFVFLFFIFFFQFFFLTRFQVDDRLINESFFSFVKFLLYFLTFFSKFFYDTTLGGFLSIVEIFPKRKKMKIRKSCIWFLVKKWTESWYTGISWMCIFFSEIESGKCWKNMLKKYFRKMQAKIKRKFTRNIFNEKFYIQI